MQFPIRPDMILIDLDGTLIDSVPDLAFCVDGMMRELNQPPHGEAAVRNWVGNGVDRLIKRALTGTLDGEPSDAEFERACPIFLRLYGDNTATRSHPYPGVREGLDWLRDCGYRLGCVTNKAARFTEPLLADTRLRDLFQVVVSGDTLPEKKPSPMPLLHAASMLGADASRALMIGDSVSDVKAARAAGFGIICMSYGYNHGQDIRDAEPDAVIDSMTELGGLLAAEASG
ncbi:MAG: phosphoglycolate phosphatase [Thiohalocapsa sp.]